MYGIWLFQKHKKVHVLLRSCLWYVHQKSPGKLCGYQNIEQYTDSGYTTDIQKISKGYRTDIRFIGQLRLNLSKAFTVA